MDSSPAEVARRQPWPSLWAAAIISLIGQLVLCQFFTFGKGVPFSIDVNPSNIWKYAYHFPPRGEFLTLNWFGIANLPPTLNPFSFAAAHLPPWLFFTTYAPFIGTAALLAMALFLRELDLPRPAALLGGVIYAWQGDLLPFVFPGHYGYITTWPFFALAAWAALRAQRHWGHALIAGASCGMMVGLQPDRGSIASLLVAALYLAPALLGRASALGQIRALVLCVVTALLVSFAGFLALFQSNIVGVKLGGATSREQAYELATQYSLGPAETLTYLVPGFFGWHSSNLEGPYWGWIGQTAGWEPNHQGVRNLNLAISTTGTVASLLTVLGVCLILPGRVGQVFGRDGFSERQLDVARVLFILGVATLILSWGAFTPIYRILFSLPLMDKWRNPLKWLEMFNFAVVVLGAFGFTQVIRSLSDETQRRAVGLFFACTNALLGLMLLLSVPFAILLAAWLSTETYVPTDVAAIMHTLHVSLFIALVIGLLAWLCVVGAWHGDRLRPWDIPNPWLRAQWSDGLAPENRAATLALFCSLLVILQMAWVASKFIDPIEMSRLTASNPLLDSLRAEGPLVRVAVPQPQDSLLNFFLQNQFAGERISSIDISAASRIPDNLTAFVNAFAGHTAKLWIIGGVKNAAIAQQQIATLRQDPEIASNIASADGYTLGASPDDQPTHALVRMKDYFVKAIFVPNVAVDKNDDDVLKRLTHAKWDPRNTVLLSLEGEGAANMPLIGNAQPLIADDVGVGLGPANSAPTPTTSTPGLKSSPAQAAPVPNPHIPVTVTRYTPHEIDLALNTPIAGYVLINDQFDPDWQVTINDKPAPLLRADYLLRAVQVQAGESHIVLRYVAHYRLGPLHLPVIATNDFSDAVMLLAFIGGVVLVWRERRAASR